MRYTNFKRGKQLGFYPLKKDKRQNKKNSKSNVKTFSSIYHHFKNKLNLREHKIVLFPTLMFPHPFSASNVSIRCRMMLFSMDQIERQLSLTLQYGSVKVDFDQFRF